MKITPKVDSMLRHLQKSDAERARHLWIDAICINQDDEKEKSQQVRLMSYVFTCARRVRVWLGEAKTEDRIPEVFDFLINVVRKKRLKTPWNHDVIDMRNGEISRFLSRAWFTRRWVLQEFVLACDLKVHCGRHSLAGEWFMKSIDVLNERSKAGSKGLSPMAMDALEALAEIRDRQHGTLSLLRRCHRSECTDNRDRIFALWGLEDVTSWTSSPGSLRDRFPIDYSKDWLETYMALTLHYASHGRMCEIALHLFEFGSLRQQSQNWPSFVPSWNLSRTRSWRPLDINTNESSGRVDRRHVDTPCLRVRGFLSTPVEAAPLKTDACDGSEHPMVEELRSLLKIE
jgi:hypothetical protein